ncbi:hypothetical protein BC830DRAFT_1107649 [Chytriomyces sp. MP71]|nr:hypothetical protein BC830DRAFT_1107649 [Chytriomyces sp. MP71]
MSPLHQGFIPSGLRTLPLQAPTTSTSHYPAPRPSSQPHPHSQPQPHAHRLVPRAAPRPSSQASSVEADIERAGYLAGLALQKQAPNNIHARNAPAVQTVSRKRSLPTGKIAQQNRALAEQSARNSELKAKLARRARQNGMLALRSEVRKTVLMEVDAGGVDVVTEKEGGETVTAVVTDSKHNEDKVQMRVATESNNTPQVSSGSSSELALWNGDALQRPESDSSTSNIVIPSQTLVTVNQGMHQVDTPSINSLNKDLTVWNGDALTTSTQSVHSTIPPKSVNSSDAFITAKSTSIEDPLLTRHASLHSGTRTASSGYGPRKGSVLGIRAGSRRTQQSLIHSPPQVQLDRTLSTFASKAVLGED